MFVVCGCSVNSWLTATAICTHFVPSYVIVRNELIKRIVVARLSLLFYCLFIIFLFYDDDSCRIKERCKTIMDDIKQTSGVANIEYVDTSLDTHRFTEKIGNTTVSFSVLRLKDSVFLWIGSDVEPRLVNMCVAMKSPYDSLPLTTQILGPRTNDTSSGLASQLTRRLNKPVFVSLNVELDRLLFSELSKRLNDEIKNKPHCF